MTETNDGFNRVWLAFKNLDNTFELVKLADKKASFLLSVELALVGAALTLLPGTLRLAKTLWDGAYGSLLSIGVMITFTVFIGLLMVGSYNLYQVVRPRRSPEVGGASPFYFDEVAKRSRSELVSELMNMDEKEAIGGIAAQTIAHGKIAKAKYDRVEGSLNKVGIGVIVGVIFLVLYYVSQIIVVGG